MAGVFCTFSKNRHEFTVEIVLKTNRKQNRYFCTKTGISHDVCSDTYQRKPLGAWSATRPDTQSEPWGSSLQGFAWHLASTWNTEGGISIRRYLLFRVFLNIVSKTKFVGKMYIINDIFRPVLAAQIWWFSFYFVEVGVAECPWNCSVESSKAFL